MMIPNPATDLLPIPPYSLDQRMKEALLLPKLLELTQYHREHCPEYARLLRNVFPGFSGASAGSLADLPFLPVSLFKNHDLKSVPDDEVVKILTSSGTTGQSSSRIHLDRETAKVQAAVLVKLVQHFIGTSRLPMVILDYPGVVKDRASFSARGAGILGMAQFGHRPFYALKDDLSLDLEGLRNYLNEVKTDKILLFGFTFMVWQGLVLALEKAGDTVDLSRGILVHSGGWKKIQDQAVSQAQFRERLRRVSSLEKVVNFYGMVEQVGGVYFENPLYFHHAPIYSDIIIRDPASLRPVPDGEPGLIQVLSCIPGSYPGHSLLTEDLGIIRGVDHPDLSMKGRFFEVLGRVPKAEVRGCSDTVETPGAGGR
jgi:hypothetical protein